jgi:hypothetical protein
VICSFVHNIMFIPLTGSSILLFSDVFMSRADEGETVRPSGTCIGSVAYEGNLLIILTKSIKQNHLDKFIKV